jgi:hypothetical protein
LTKAIAGTAAALAAIRATARKSVFNMVVLLGLVAG